MCRLSDSIIRANHNYERTESAHFLGKLTLDIVVQMKISWAAGQRPICTTKAGHTERPAQQAVELYIDFAPREVRIRSVPPPPLSFVLFISAWSEWLSAVVTMRAGLIRTHTPLCGSGKIRDRRGIHDILAT